ncbi:MAG: hypothetical protein ABFD58_05435 [Anaerolineaceae bacterium]
MKRAIVYITNRIKYLISLINKLFSQHKRNSEPVFENMSEKIKNDLSKLNSLDKDQKIKINEDIKKMISYYNQLTDQIESRRTRLVESSWQTLTILIAASGLLIAAKLTWIILYPALIIFGIQIIFAIAKLHEYQAQSGFKYPFNNSGYGNKWKWFYHANPFIKSINPNPFQKEKENQKNLLPYLEGLHFFVDSYANETIDKELQDNIQQLYLLQVHNFYKNKFFLRLNKYDLWANRVSFTLLFAYLGALIGYCLFILIW